MPQLDAARLLLDAGLDARAVNDEGSLPLHFAAMRGDAEMAQLLLAVEPTQVLPCRPCRRCAAVRVDGGRGGPDSASPARGGRLRGPRGEPRPWPSGAP